MQLAEAARQLAYHDQQGQYIFTQQGLAKIFAQDSARALRAGLARLVQQSMLLRVTRGVYVNAQSRHLGPDTLARIAVFVRQGEYNYVSLESALSEYGVISQMPLDRLTVMTTGRKGEYATPFGTLEFTHTRRSVADVLAGCRQVGRPLRLATRAVAWRDLKRVGRNLHLVDQSQLYADAK